MSLPIRWKLASWFVGLSSLVYLTLTLASIMVFYLSSTHVLDSELAALSTQASRGIYVSQPDGFPHFRPYQRIVQSEHGRLIATIEVFSADGKLIDAIGPEGIGRMVQSGSELKLDDRNMRVDRTALTLHGKLIGYLQVELPTAARDDALYNLALTIAFIGPLVVLGLGWASYVVSGKAAQPLEENVRTLRQFVADASHELNTPIAIVQAKLENVQRKMLRANQPTEDLSVIEHHLERMTKIVKDLTFLAEIESPVAKETTNEFVDVAGLAHNTIRAFLDRYQEKKVVLSSDIERAQTLGSAEMIDRLLTNLVENALRYTESGGSVNVQVSADASDIRISVQDTGIGIAPEHLPKIFDRFYRVDRSRSRASGGSGIGLSIVKAIAEAHHGQVVAESTPGKGSIFTVTLPVRSLSLARNLHDNQPSVQ